MLVTCHTHCYGRFGALAAIEHVRDAGLEAIELPIRTAGMRSRWGDEPLLTTDSTQADLDRIDRLLAEQGVRIASCACQSGNLLDPANFAAMRRKLDLAAHFGVAVVVGEAGNPHSDDECQQVYARLRDIGDYADRLGITVCLDTQRGLCVNHRAMRETLADLDHPRLRINFDTGNLLYFNQDICGEVSLAKCCDLVRHVHLKDSRGNFGEWDFPELGTGGAVDFLRTYQLLRDCGFRGPASILVEGAAGEPELSLAEHHRRVVESVKYLRGLGYF